MHSAFCILHSAFAAVRHSALLLLLCAGLAPAGAADTREYLPLFRYDASKALSIKEHRVSTRGKVSERDISFASAKGGRVTAFLLVPEGKGPFPALLFMHGATGSRRTLLPGARLMCEAGAVCLLIDAPYCGDRAEMGKRFGDMRKPEEMRDNIIHLVVDLRRAIDVLLARPDVDPKRLGFVGSSMGGAIGGLLAGVDKRIAAYALLAATGNWQDAVTKSSHPMARLARATTSREKLEKAVRVLACVDPIHYIGDAAPSALLFQIGRKDTTVPVECADAYQQAGSNPKTCKWYDDGHSLNVQAFMDRAAWFREKIGLGAVAEPESNDGLNH